MQSASNALSFDASVAASQHIAKLEGLVSRFEKDPHVLADAELRAGLVRIAQALGIDSFELAPRNLRADERRARIAVACIEVCRELQTQTGGSLLVSTLAEKLSSHLKLRVSTDEALAAVNELAVLGPGLRLEKLPNSSVVVRSAATELSSDQGSILAACDVLGYVTADMLMDNLGWNAQRASVQLDHMVSAGLLWVDLQCDPTQYWTPGAI